MRRARRVPLALLSACLVVAAACAAGGTEPEKPAAPAAAEAPQAHHGDDATVHHGFEDVDSWVKLFDDPSRDEWQKPEVVVGAIGVRPGMLVADLGAGTGYFTKYLSRAVGGRGIVLAIDPEPNMTRHLGERARKEGLTNVVPVLALLDDPFLPDGRVDRVLIVDTYHHIDARRAYFGRMRAAMAPGGQVAIVDFHKRPLPVGPPPEHKLDRTQVIDEMTAAGWRLAREFDGLPYQYVLLFEPAATGGATS